MIAPTAFFDSTRVQNDSDSTPIMVDTEPWMNDVFSVRIFRRKQSHVKLISFQAFRL